MAERMGDKRPLLWQRHRETPSGGSKHRRTLYSASQGGRKTTWYDSTAEHHRDIDSPGPGATEVVMASSRDQMQQSSSRSE